MSVALRWGRSRRERPQRSFEAPRRRPAVVLAVLLATATPAAAEVQSTFQQACILGLSHAGAGVARIAAKRFVRCLRAASRSDLPPGTTAEQCLAADLDGRLADAQLRVTRAQMKT